MASLSSNSARKPLKKSSLRRSIAFDDLPQDAPDDDSNDLQLGNKPSLGRSSSLIKKKKRPASSRLSFGTDQIISGDAAEALEDEEATFTPRKPTLGRRAVESNASKKAASSKRLPLPMVRARNDDEERPTYNKDYLNQLKSSTPTAPKDLKELNVKVEEEEGLDASELEGAMIVDVEKFGAGTSTPAASFIPSEAEIREKKDRRARLAQEKDFISLDDEGDDGRSRQLSLLSRTNKAEGRLVREDEDLGEGFDEFVDDGRISLGKKQEREAKRRHRKEMADMIRQAEGSSDGESDDSEAERRAAYEAAQTRAGMDGLVKSSDTMDIESVQVPSRITPLPALSECLERLQTTLTTMEQELAKRQKKTVGLEKEKTDILAREKEVQDLLKQAGARYAALRNDSVISVGDPQALMEAHDSGLAGRMFVDRGLESFGNTPTTRPEVADIG